MRRVDEIQSDIDSKEVLFQEASREAQEKLEVLQKLSGQISELTAELSAAQRAGE